MSSEGRGRDQGSWPHRAEAALAGTKHGDDAVGGGRPCWLRVSSSRWQEAQTTHRKDALRLSGPRLKWGQS